jgi:hypothetical protein
MDVKPIPTLSEEVNDIRTRTANIVAEHIIPNEKDIYSGGDKSNLSERILDKRSKKKSYGRLIYQKSMVEWG